MKVKHLLLPIITILVIYQCSLPQERNVATPEQIEEQLVAYAISGVIEETKKRLRDPKSMEVINQTFERKDKHIHVTLNFRSKNGFGGMNQGMVKAITLESGVVTQIEISEL